MSVAYEFKAEAAPAQGFGVPVKLDKTLDVKRSLPTHELPHHSVRVFPPTIIKASVHFPQVFHPIGSNTMTLRLHCIARVNAKVNTVEYWKLKKLTWKIEEVAKTVAPACEKHTPKDGSSSNTQQQPAKKGVLWSVSRVFGVLVLFCG